LQSFPRFSRLLGGPDVRSRTRIPLLCLPPRSVPPTVLAFFPPGESLSRVRVCVLPPGSPLTKRSLLRLMGSPYSSALASGSHHRTFFGYRKLARHPRLKTSVGPLGFSVPLISFEKPAIACLRGLTPVCLLGLLSFLAAPRGYPFIGVTRKRRLSAFCGLSTV